MGRRSEPEERAANAGVLPAGPALLPASVSSTAGWLIRGAIAVLLIAAGIAIGGGRAEGVSPSATVYIHPTLRLCPGGVGCRPLPDGTKVSIAYVIGAPGNQCTFGNNTADKTYVAPHMGTGTYVVYLVNIGGSCDFLSAQGQYKIGFTAPNGTHIGDILINIDQGPPNIFAWVFSATCGYNTRPHLVRCQNGSVSQLKGGEGKNAVTIPFDLDVTAS